MLSKTTKHGTKQQQELINLICQFAKDTNERALSEIKAPIFYFHEAVGMLAKEGEIESVNFLITNFKASCDAAVNGYAIAGLVAEVNELVEQGANRYFAINGYLMGGHLTSSNLLRLISLTADEKLRKLLVEKNIFRKRIFANREQEKEIITYIDDLLQKAKTINTIMLDKLLTFEEAKKYYVESTASGIQEITPIEVSAKESISTKSWQDTIYYFKGKIAVTKETAKLKQLLYQAPIEIINELLTDEEIINYLLDHEIDRNEFNNDTSEFDCEDFTIIDSSNDKMTEEIIPHEKEIETQKTVLVENPKDNKISKFFRNFFSSSKHFYSSTAKDAEWGEEFAKQTDKSYLVELNCTKALTK